MLFRCPDCGRIKYYLQWKIPDKRMQKEAENYKGDVVIIPVKCPKCKVKK